MKKIICLFTIFLAICSGVIAKDIKMPQYDIIGAGSGIEGTILVKVYVYNKDVSDADFKRAAVHGIVFKGCEGNANGARQPAMAPPATEHENKAYCDVFFAIDGECQNYASIIAGSYERVKTKKGYTHGAILQIDNIALRKELEKAGIVRSLSSGF